MTWRLAKSTGLVRIPNKNNCLVEFSGESVSLSKPAPEEFKKDWLIFENCQSIDEFNVVARMCKLYTKDSSTKELARLAPNLLEDEVRRT